MRLTEARVDLLPVEVLLPHNSFDTLLQNAVLEAEILDSHTFMVLTINLLLDEW